MNCLVIIPARGGSKGVPKKNIKLLNGKALISYTIDAAKKVFNNETIVVSTDSLEIKEVVEENDLTVPFLRPKHLASDTAGTHEVLLHALEHFESMDRYFDVLVLLQPTSPFREEKHIIEALKKYTPDLDMVVSVKEAKGNPYYNLFEENSMGYLSKSKENNALTRRQDCPDVWEYNGAIYIINISSLKKEKLHEFKNVVKYVMDEESSHDIDSNLDWLVAEQILKNKTL